MNRAWEAQTANRRGEWVPAIPLPLFVRGRKVCCGSLHDGACGARFWTLRGYRGHYALVHVLGLENR